MTLPALVTGDLGELTARYLTADPELVACPFPMFERLRRQAPVYYVGAGRGVAGDPVRGYLRGGPRPGDVSSLARPARTAGAAGDARRAGAESAELRGYIEAGRLPRPGAGCCCAATRPGNTQQRKLVNKAFSPRRVRQIEAPSRASATADRTR